ncbi:MAG: hypothetical protein M3P93_04845, partial [Actinomycetota bacterium]|nr:hypothetical protein [Actinomycetota bacterium]
MISLRDSLRRADDRVVPYAAARLRAAVDGRRPPQGATQVRPGGTAGVLRRLDARYARRGVPQLAALALTGVLVAGSAVLLAGLPDDDRDGGAALPPASSDRVVLGPEVGVRVEEYLSATRSRAVELSRQRPEASHVALVSFEGYARPEQADAALGDLEVLRAYLRAPGDEPSEVLAPEVGDLVPDLEALYAATARRRAQDAQELRALAGALGANGAAQRSA